MPITKYVTIPLSSTGAEFIAAREFFCMPMNEAEFVLFRDWLNENAPLKIRQIVRNALLVRAKAVQ